MHKQVEDTNATQELSSYLSGKESVEIPLRELSGRVIAGQDLERRRIARELHDSLGQKVALLKMNLDRLNKFMNLHPEPAALLSDSVSLAGMILTEVRTISHLLHPPLLEELGLISALRSLSEGFAQRSGIRVSLQIDDNLALLPAAVQISLYRIIQECLTNIHRHSGSLTAKVCLKQLPTAIQVEVEDEGRGMPAKISNNGLGVGLTGIKERAAELGGSLQVRSNQKGTQVIVLLPLWNEVGTSNAKSA
jgi:two-component system NarL family sensor kinase